MMKVGFGVRPCICLRDRRGTESILGDWSGENVVKVIQWLSHTPSPLLPFLALSAVTLSLFRPIFFLSISVWAPDSLSLLILLLWHRSFYFRHVSQCRASGGNRDWKFTDARNHCAPHRAHCFCHAEEEEEGGWVCVWAPFNAPGMFLFLHNFFVWFYFRSSAERSRGRGCSQDQPTESREPQLTWLTIDLVLSCPC